MFKEKQREEVARRMGTQTIDTSAKSIVIAVNPSSGARDNQAVARTLGRLLEENGFDVHVPGDIPTIRRLASEFHGKNQLRTVVAAGGDGTAAMLVNELPFPFPLAVLPLGTENLLAKYLCLTSDPEQLCKMIIDGRLASLDVGRANEKYFLVMCSCGFDADVVSRLHSVRKGNINHWSYARPIIDAISRYRYPTLRIEVDGSGEIIKSKWAFVFNIPRYAMNLAILPNADSADGKLDLCTFRGGNLWRGLFYLCGIILGQHQHWKDTNLAKFSSLVIESDEAVPYQLDGDPGGELPLKIEVVPGHLKVIVDETWMSDKDRMPRQAGSRPAETAFVTEIDTTHGEQPETDKT